MLPSGEVPLIFPVLRTQVLHRPKRKRAFHAEDVTTRRRQPGLEGKKASWHLMGSLVGTLARSSRGPIAFAIPGDPLGSPLYWGNLSRVTAFCYFELRGSAAALISANRVSCVLLRQYECHGTVMTVLVM